MEKTDTYFSLVVYVPASHVEQVKDALFEAGAGCLGNYSRCCWETSGRGQFLPGEGSDPYAGEHGRVEQAEEYRVEMICSQLCIQEAIQALHEAHPYETPAFHYWEVYIQ